MSDHRLIDQKMREHYEAVWSAGDAWELESSGFEQARYDRQLELLEGERYGRALEIGCGSGCFTPRLARVADEVVALDISSAAIERARARVSACAAPGAVQFRVANVMEYDLAAEGPWDLVVLSETIYCLGWLYPFFDLGVFAANILASLRPGGRLLLANTYGAERDWLLRPWLIDTYRDLFRNVGFQLESEDIFRGVKHDEEFQVLMSVFRRGVDAARL